MRRLHQSVLIISTLGLCWLVMQAVHELGHVLHAWSSGGRVVKVVLHPLTISRTDVDPNPHPLAVVWGGPLWGCLQPLLLWLALRKLTEKYAFLLRFFAGFCLIANGTYLACGGWLTAGDVADLLRHGTPVWIPVACGISLAAMGLWLWHGLGRHFGLGPRPCEINRTLAWSLALMLLLTIAAEMVFSPQG